MKKKAMSRKVGGGKSRKGDKLIILSESGRFAPDRMICRLVYQDTTPVRSVTSSDAMNWGYRSSAYDPDPAVLSGAIPGFAELANLYTAYCVHQIDAEIEIANQNTESTIAVVWPSNVLQNTNSLTTSDLLEYSGNVRAQSQIITNTAGMNRATINTVAAGMQLVGSRFKTDLDYTGSTSGNPPEMFYINVGVLNPYGNFTYGMLVRSRLVYLVEFFRLRQLES